MNKPYEVITGGFTRSALYGESGQRLGLFDYQRPPNKKEVVAFQARLSRLGGIFGQDVRRAERWTEESFPRGKALDVHGYRIREPFSYLAHPAPGEYSDRRVLRREHRPPATRLVSGNGSTLRLYLTALAVAQLRGSVGARLPVLPIAGASGTLGWTHLVATGAENAGDGANFITALDKRVRSVKQSLGTLDEAGLVELRPTEKRARAFEKFVLLNEAGKGVLDDSVEYKVPKPTEATINLPVGFVRQSWLHVLEDSELAVLLMIACGKGSISGVDEAVAVSSEERVSHYGIGRDPYSRSRKTLELFGLVSVEEIGRHFDGRAEGPGVPQLHRFKVLPNGFEENALNTVTEKLAQEVERRA